MYIIKHGCSFVGFVYWGPFKSWHDADLWARENLSNAKGWKGTYEVEEMKNPNCKLTLKRLLE